MATLTDVLDTMASTLFTECGEAVAGDGGLVHAYGASTMPGNYSDRLPMAICGIARDGGSFEYTHGDLRESTYNGSREDHHNISVSVAIGDVGQSTTTLQAAAIPWVERIPNALLKHIQLQNGSGVSQVDKMLVGSYQPKTMQIGSTVYACISFDVYVLIRRFNLASAL